MITSGLNGMSDGQCTGQHGKCLYSVAGCFAVLCDM